MSTLASSCIDSQRRSWRTRVVFFHRFPAIGATPLHGSPFTGTERPSASRDPPAALQIPIHRLKACSRPRHFIIIHISWYSRLQLPHYTRTAPDRHHKVGVGVGTRQKPHACVAEDPYWLKRVLEVNLLPDPADMIVTVVVIMCRGCSSSAFRRASTDILHQDKRRHDSDAPSFQLHGPGSIEWSVEQHVAHTTACASDAHAERLSGGGVDGSFSAAVVCSSRQCVDDFLLMAPEYP